MHEHTSTLLQVLYVGGNTAIALGYAAVPPLVLPYLPLTRKVMAFAAAFFALCGLTHAGMAFGHQHVPVTWFWALEHVAQAIATWGFIVTFHMLLRRAARTARAGAAGAAPAKGAS